MYSKFKLATDLTRIALPALAAALFVPSHVVAQHFEFDTRYRATPSANQWQSPSPWHSQQTFPSGFHQLSSPVQFAQPMMKTMAAPQIVQPTIVEPQYLDHNPLPISSGVVALPQEVIAPVYETPINQTPLYETPVEPLPLDGAESEQLPAQWGQTIPEGYDPAYPIEYPGDDYQGYYPVEGGVVAPQSEFSVSNPLPPAGDSLPTLSDTEKSFSNESSADDQAPIVPSVVVENFEANVVLPPGLEQNDEMPMLSEQDGNSAAMETQPDAGSSKKTMMDDAASEQKTMMDDAGSEQSMEVAKLMQQLQAAELRAREAEEKSLAIARQAAENQARMDQLRDKLDQSNRDSKKMESRAAKSRKNIEELQAELAKSNQTMDQLKSESAEAQLQLSQMQTEAAAAIDDKTAKIEEAMAKAKEAMADSSTELKLTEEPEPAETKAPPQETLSQKLESLKTSRDKQLASAAKRIKADFEAKINAKLDSGKTTEHPEVKALENSMKLRLKMSDTNIRKRYKRQINKARKEAMARSRS